MSKIITDIEMVDIIRKAVNDPGVIECNDSYRFFVESLAGLIADHFGGRVGIVSDDGDGLGMAAAFHIDENVPSDGGVFKYYDTDVVWEGGEELEKGKSQFEVHVRRESIGFHTINVSAVSEEEAREIALDMAGDFEYPEKSAEYEVDDVRRRE